MTPEGLMKRAISCGEKAKALGEVPVGAVIVREGKVIATGYNKRETGKNALLHAEIVAIDRACKKLGTWRLSDCDLYVTLEPCPMCTGAILNARIRRVFIGAMDPKAGCMGSVCDLTDLPFNHKPEVIRGVSEAECASLLSSFFRELRLEKKPMEKEIRLRSFTLEDAPDLRRFLYPKRTEKTVSAMIGEWNTRLFEGRYCEFFAVTADGSPVGYVQLCQQPDGSVSAGAHIFSDFRGKGYGTKAVVLLLEKAREMGLSAVTARVRKTNVPSCKLCKTVGFAPVGEDVTAKGHEVWKMYYNLED